MGGVSYNLNGNHTNYLAQLCGRFLTFWKITTAIFRLLWRYLPTELRNI